MRSQLLPCIALLCCGIAPAAERTNEAPAQPVPFRMPRTLADVDAMIETLHTSLWALPPGLSAKAGDPTLDEDAAEYLMTDAMLKALADERQRLARLTDDVHVALPEHELSRMMELRFEEICRRTILVNYWRDTSVPAVVYRQQIAQSLLQRLPEGRRAEAASELDRLGERARPRRADLAGDIGSCKSSEQEPPYAVRGAELSDAYDELRFRMAAILSDAWIRGELEAPVHQRTTPCPAPAAPMPSGRVTVLKRADHDRFYPELERSMLVEGTTRVRLSYDAGGCVTRATVFATSGVEAMDMAAVQVAFATELAPQLVDGKPSGGGVVQPLTFSLKDEGSFPPTAPGMPPQPQP